MNIVNLTKTDKIAMKSVIKSSARIHKYGQLPKREAMYHNGNVNYLKSRFGKKWKDMTWDFAELEGLDVPGRVNFSTNKKRTPTRLGKIALVILALITALIVYGLVVSVKEIL